MKFRPLNNGIIVQKDEVKDTTTSGLALPDQAVQPSREGVVVAVGPGEVMKSGTRYPMTLKAGDRVVFCAHAGFVLDFKERLYALTDHDILAVRE